MTPDTDLRERLAGASSPPVLVVGDSHVTRGLVEELHRTVEVTVLTDDPVVARVEDGTADEAGVEIVEGDPTATGALRRADARDASVAVVALSSDAATLLVTRLLRRAFGVEEVVALVEDPAVDAVDDVDTICASETVAAHVTEEFTRRYA